jgi:uncharacterized membrane protein
MASKVSFAVSRVIEVALVALGVSVFIGDSDIVIACWDIVAVVYLSIRIARLRRNRRSDGTEWLDRGLGGRAGLVFTIFTSVVGIIAGLAIVMSEDAAEKTLSTLVGLPAVFFAWAILHFGYAERYAKSYYAGLPERPLAFPHTDNPSFIEFAYFSFTLGTTFSVSDVETQTSAIRLQILSHSVLSFIYNTATIGIAVSVITG